MVIDLDAAPAVAETPTATGKPSARAGWGTILYEDKTGAAFRVWAPFARGVSVAIWRNDLETRCLLASESNGWWSADVDGAKVGDEYDFVLDGVPELRRANPYASQVRSSVGRCVIHDPNYIWSTPDFALPRWNDLVIYELHVGTFNDPTLNHPGPGTFDLVCERLDHLVDLGVNAIEIMPVAEYMMDRSWGYNPALPFAVENALGGPQKLYTFVDAAHDAGIAVILDVVYNHVGPQDNALWCYDGWTDAEHRGGIYFYDNARVATCWGDTRPDYGRPEVRDFYCRNARFWLEKYRIDGLRFDSVVNIRNSKGQEGGDGWLQDGWDMLRRMNDEIGALEPGRLTIAEDMQGNDGITRPTSDGGAGFGSQWDGRFNDRIRSALVGNDDAGRSMPAVRDALQAPFGGACRRVIYTESHDSCQNGHARVPEEIWPAHADSYFSKKRSTLGGALVLTAPGIPMLFQGQEFLEDRWFNDQWQLDWSKDTTFAGIHSLYRDLIHLRRNRFDTTRGLRGDGVNVFHVNDADKLVAFHRWQDGGPRDDVVVVANFADRRYDSYTIGFPRPGLWKVRFNSDWRGYSSDFGDTLGYDAVAEEDGRDGLWNHGNVGIGPYSVLILSQDA